MVASVQPLHYASPMPTIVRLSSCAITMYAADHQPPHFHVRMNDGREALVAIATLELISGSLPKRELAEALHWASHNKAALSSRWKELNP